MYSWSASRQRREHRQSQNFSIDRLGVRAEAGLVTKPFAIEAVVINRSVMHVRADVGVLDDRTPPRPRALEIWQAKFINPWRAIEISINDPLPVLVVMIDHVELQGELARMIQITAQEEFWAGEFGDNYIDRNQSQEVLVAKIAMFARIVQRCSDVRSVRELGANIGLNILALKSLFPYAAFQAIEINSQAFERLATIPGIAASNTTLFEPVEWSSVDLAFTAGVLIHLNPDMLPVAYERLYEASNRYVLVAEYYNPSVVEISYRGHSGRLWKRDFAGEMMDKYSDLKLVDYGFIYHRDPGFPADDLTWFLMEKRA